MHTADAVDGWLDVMAAELAPLFAPLHAPAPQTAPQTALQTAPETVSGTFSSSAAFIGIRRGGVHVARALRERVAPDSPFGELDIAFYRDDFGTRGLHPRVGPSAIDFDVDGRTVVLVDDVIGTGRTVRAALNEIFDFGRPARVVLATLVDRAGRELPFAADVVGAHLDVNAAGHVDYDAAAGTVTVRDGRTTP